MTRPTSTRLRPAAALIAALALGGCATEPFDAETTIDDSASVNVIDATNLNDLMLTISDPEDAVAYFRRSLNEDPDRLDLKRGYALSLARARRHADAVRIFEELDRDGAADAEVRLEHAHSLARLQRWEEAENQMALISGDVDSPRRHLIDAMLADQRNNWDQADLSYEAARRLSANPAAILNNWGVSRMSRGDYKAAQTTFEEAIAYNPRLFSIKNNLAVSRALQGEYRLPLITMTEEERARLLHNVGVIALRRGDADRAKGLFTMAVAAHPRFYPQAAEKLAALENTVVN